MIRNAQTLAQTILLLAVHCTLATGQQPPLSVLTIDLEK